MLFPVLFYSFVAYVFYKLICKISFYVCKNSNSHRNKIKLVACVVAISIPISLVTYREITTPDIEWNPLIKSEQVIVGSWSGVNESLVLKTDHTFLLTHNNQEYSGGWSLDDWNLTFDYYLSDTPYGYLRVIYHSDSYHLVKDTLNKDPDVWNYENSLVKQ